MSMQQPSFSDRENTNNDPAPGVYYAEPETRNVNVDPREQRQTPPEQEYQEGYGGQEPYFGGPVMEEKIRPVRRRKGWIWVMALLVVAVLLGLGLISAQVGAVSSRSTQTHTFAVSGTPKLVVHDSSGTVHIHTGDGNAVTIQATKQAVGIGANANDINVNYSQNGNEVDVSVNPSFSFLGFNNVDLDVTLPTNANMQVETGSGDVEASDVDGQVDLQTGSGDITTTNINGQVDLQTGSGDIDTTNVGGQVALKTGSGSIDVNGLNGQATINTGSGDITIKGAALSGTSLMQTDSGDISYNGSLNPSGNYRFETGSGTVELTLPPSAAFSLHASTDSGEVNNDFGSNNIGRGQQPSLTINTDSGDIDLQKEGQ